jgi:tetratricopeptide (TPR) repeat protein
LERARALCHQWNLAMLAVAGRGRLGQAYVLSGRLAEGIALLGQAASAFGIMQHRAAASITYAQLGQAYLLADRRADALDCARRSLAIASEGGQRGHEAMATWLFGEIAAIDGGLGQADGHYRDALALAQKIGFRPLVAHCHRSLAKLHGRSGTRERSSEHFAIATAMYREMDMQFYLQQVEAEKLQLP